MMIYLSVIITVLVILLILSNEQQTSKMKEQKKHNIYQRSVNDIVLELHKQMLDELRKIEENTEG
jgi:hypothetical protein